MSRALAQGLAHALILERDFEPLVQTMPGLAAEAALFDHCLAAWRQEGLSIILLWAGEAPQGLLAHRVQLLTQALKAHEALKGRVSVGLLQVLEAEPSVAQSAVLAECPRGNFLSKILVSYAQAWPQGFAPQGRWEAWPEAAWFKGLDSLRLGADEATVAATLEERRREEDNVLRWTRPWVKPWAVWTLVGLCVADFGVMILVQGSLNPRGSLIPALGGGSHGMPAESMACLLMGADNRERVLGMGEFWRLVASLFLHFSLWHLVANMASLLSLGALYERMAGVRRFLAVYLISGLVASGLSLLNAPVLVAQGYTTLNLAGGASGAILGLAGALLALAWRRPPSFPKTLARRLARGLWMPLVLIFSLGLVLALSPSPLKVDNWAHLGGLLCGLGLGLAWPLKGRIELRA